METLRVKSFLDFCIKPVLVYMILLYSVQLETIKFKKELSLPSQVWEEMQGFLFFPLHRHQTRSPSGEPSRPKPTFFLDK